MSVILKEEQEAIAARLTRAGACLFKVPEKDLAERLAKELSSAELSELKKHSPTLSPLKLQKKLAEMNESLRTLPVLTLTVARALSVKGLQRVREVIAVENKNYILKIVQTDAFLAGAIIECEGRRLARVI